MFLDMSGTGEPHRGLGRLFVRKRARWPHLWARTPWSGNSGLCKPEPRTPQNKHGECTALNCTHRLFALTAIEIRCVEPRKAPVAVEVS